jgi:hypothetical protein
MRDQETIVHLVGVAVLFVVLGYMWGRDVAAKPIAAPASVVAPEDESACEKKFTQVFHGMCRELQCQRIWDDKAIGSSDSNLKERYPTQVDGTAPIGCPMIGEVPWVRCAEFNRVEFMCLPAELTQ